MKSCTGSPSSASRLSENGLFWIALILLSMGAITTFYYQGNMAMRTMSYRIYTERPQTSDQSILTIYDTDTGKPRTIILPDDAGVVPDP